MGPTGAGARELKHAIWRHLGANLRSKLRFFAIFACFSRRPVWAKNEVRRVIITMLRYDYGGGIEIRADVTAVSVYEHGVLAETVPIVPVRAETMPQPHITFLGYIFGDGSGDSVTTGAAATHALYIEWAGGAWIAYSHVVSGEDLHRNGRIRVCKESRDHRRVYSLFDPSTGIYINSHELYDHYKNAISRWTDDRCSWCLILHIAMNGEYKIEVIFPHGMRCYNGDIYKLSNIPDPASRVRIFELFIDDYLLCVELEPNSTTITRVYKWRPSNDVCSVLRNYIGLCYNAMREQPRKVYKNTIVSVTPVGSHSIEWVVASIGGFMMTGYGIEFLMYIGANFIWHAAARAVCGALGVKKYPREFFDYNERYIMCKVSNGRLKLTNTYTRMIIEATLNERYKKLAYETDDCMHGNAIYKMIKKGTIYNWSEMRAMRED